MILGSKSCPEFLGSNSTAGWSKTVTCYLVRVSRSEDQDKVSLPLDLLVMCFRKSRELTLEIWVLFCHLARIEKYLRVSKAHFCVSLWRCLQRRLTKERRHWVVGHHHIGWEPQKEQKRKPASISTPALCFLAMGLMNSFLLLCPSADYTSSQTQKHRGGQPDVETSEALSRNTLFFSLSCLCWVSRHTQKSQNWAGSNRSYSFNLNKHVCSLGSIRALTLVEWFFPLILCIWASFLTLNFKAYLCYSINKMEII